MQWTWQVVLCTNGWLARSVNGRKLSTPHHSPSLAFGGSVDGKGEDEEYEEKENPEDGDDLLESLHSMYHCVTRLY